MSRTPAYAMQEAAAGFGGQCIRKTCIRLLIACLLQIPGGPKLARTPMGRTPATGGFLPVPGSAVAQHYPGSAARGVHFAALPGSASLPRYPGSAAAAHRLGGLTPQHVPPPMTFQVRPEASVVSCCSGLLWQIAAAQCPNLSQPR